MLRGYRGIVAALIGLILVAASPGGQRSNPQQAKPRQDVSETLSRIADALDEANKPQREAADCPEGGEDRQSDLCAQWKAADAARQAAAAADWTVTIGWVGVVLGAITMGAAIAAAKFAYDAAVHTRDSNAIMRASEDGYLVIDKIEGIHREALGTHFLLLDMTIDNVGRCAVRIHRIETDAEPVNMADTIPAGGQKTFKELIFHPLDGPPPCNACLNGPPIPILNITIDQTTPLRGRFVERSSYYVIEQDGKWAAYLAPDDRTDESNKSNHGDLTPD